jgi:glycogen operon protein
MLLMGDEMSRSQAGNNNAYAQDNEISWFDWKTATHTDPGLFAFTCNLIALRRAHDAFRRRKFLNGATVPASGLKDVYWLAPEGREMTTEDWGDGERRTLGIQLGNDAADGVRFLLLINGSPEPVDFRLPRHVPPGEWRRVFDTTLPEGLVRETGATFTSGGTFGLDARSLVLFQIN